MWRAHAATAWRALVRDTFRRRRNHLRVIDEPGGGDVSLWPFVHVLWAAADLRVLGEEIHIDALEDVLDALRAGA